jgi:CubicO group peptidase (beta-lactamase class C family)
MTFASCYGRQRACVPPSFQPQVPHRRSLRIPGRLAAICLALSLTACGGDDAPAPPPAATDYSALQASVSATIEAGMAALGVRGLSIALVDGNGVPWARGFGMADAERGIPADADTIYEAGSVSKVFTAAAVMQLVEQGRLKLDRPIEEAIPGFRIRSRFAQTEPVTPRLLLTHHAGLPEDLSRGGFAASPVPLATLASWLADEYLAYPPGQMLAYSNVGFNVLGRAIEIAGGEPFPDHMERQLLAPLGMKRSAFRPLPAESARLAKGYGHLAPADYPRAWLDNGVADGGLRSSVRDMTRFMRAMLDGGRLDRVSVIRPSSLQESWRPQNPGVPLDLDQQIGLAWFLETLPAKRGDAVRMAFHGGSSIYHQAYMALLPDHGLGVVIMANTDTAGALLHAVARDTLRQALKARHGIELADAPALPDAKPVTRTGEELAALAGLYASAMGPAVIEPAGGQLRISVAGSVLGQLEPHQHGLFKLADDNGNDSGDASADGSGDQWFSFERIGAYDALLAHTAAGRGWAGVRVEPYALSDSWRSRLGRYALPAGAPREIIEQVDVVEVGGFLMLGVRVPMSGPEPFPVLLRPEGEHLAIVLGMGRGKNEAVRFGADERSDYLVYKGVRLERIADAGASAARAP